MEKMADTSTSESIRRKHRGTHEHTGSLLLFCAFLLVEYALSRPRLAHLESSWDAQIKQPRLPKFSNRILKSEWTTVTCVIS